MTVVARSLQQVPGFDHGPDEKVVALTFDDAPGPNTAAVLDALADCNTLATFFVVGESVEREPELTRRIAAEGHTIGNHSWTHTRVEELADSAVQDEFRRTGDLVCELTGSVVHHARPPYTMVQADRLATLLTPLGYTAVVGWAIDPRDWEGHDTETVTERVVEQLHPGAVVLLHAGHGERRAAASAVPRIVKAGKVLGYRFVTL